MYVPSYQFSVCMLVLKVKGTQFDKEKHVIFSNEYDEMYDIVDNQ